MKTRHNTTVREVGKRWIEASTLNKHTQTIEKISLLDYIIKNELWDSTIYDLELRVLQLNPMKSLEIMWNANPEPTFIDLNTIPREIWSEYEYQNLIIPVEYAEPIVGKTLSVKESDELEIAVEKFYGITEPYYATYNANGGLHEIMFMEARN
jgi:hypothetical protein